MPKLIAEDIPLLNSLLSDVFPGVAYVPAEMTRLREEIAKVCHEVYLTYSEVGSDEIGGQWVEKVCELISLCTPVTVTKTKMVNWTYTDRCLCCMINRTMAFLMNLLVLKVILLWQPLEPVCH